MTPEEKIARVLEQIKNDSAINPDPKLIRFDLNYDVVGAGILSEDEERRILFKLEKEGVIKLRLSQFKGKDAELRARKWFDWLTILSWVEGSYPVGRFVRVRQWGFDFTWD